MNKNLIYAILAVVLVAIAASVYLKREEAELPADEKAFRMANADEGSKIFMVDKEGEKVTLLKEGDVWMVNNKFIAAPYKVELLIETLKKFLALLTTILMHIPPYPLLGFLIFNHN